jgi:hypothetical protein
MRIEKPNNLKDDIFSVPVDMQSGGSFYLISNVRTPSHTFIDISILIDGGVTSALDLAFLRRWNTKSR